jgi:hypothetical protein
MVVMALLVRAVGGEGEDGSGGMTLARRGLVVGWGHQQL